MKQTAVEWLVEQIKNDQNQKALSASEWMQVIEKAKAIEKEQSKIDYETGQASTKFKFPLSAEQYYQETYN